MPRKYLVVVAEKRSVIGALVFRLYCHTQKSWRGGGCRRETLRERLMSLSLKASSMLSLRPIVCLGCSLMMQYHTALRRAYSAAERAPMKGAGSCCLPGGFVRLCVVLVLWGLCYMLGGGGSVVIKLIVQ